MSRMPVFIEFSANTSYPDTSLGKGEVESSIPSGSTIKNARKYCRFCCCRGGGFECSHVHDCA